MFPTTEKKFRGIFGDEPKMLNKTIGCDSQTVPPLYVPILCFFGESQSLGTPREGEAQCVFPERKARVRRPTEWISLAFA